MMLAVSGAPAAQAFALDEAAQPAAGNPAALAGRDSAHGVYVRDSAIAVEKFALAQRLENLREWDKSADVYMEILRGYPDRVVPSQVDQDNRIYQYTSVAAAVQERLARWPDAGLNVYRNRYETEASAMLDEAGDDPAKLHRVVALYFVTDSARAAAMRLVDLYLVTADFPAAAWLGDRMLALHPDLGADRARLLYRTSLAYHLCGEALQAQRKLDELRERHTAATGTVRGVEVNLAESLATELDRTGMTPHATPSDSWPMAFGSVDRARIPLTASAFGARLYSVEMTPSSVRAPVTARREIERQTEQHRNSGLMTCVFPVVDRGEMFFQDNARVYAVSLESGTPLPGWADTYGGERGGRYALSAWSTPPGQQCTITVTDDAVFAVMGQPDVTAIQHTNTATARGETRLVSLDRRNGREKWAVTSRSLPQDLGLGRTLDFSGSPLVIGDTVYIMGRGGKGMQFEDAYVLAFEADSGRFRWICYLASANSGLFEFGDFGSASGQRVSHLAYWGGRLYAVTNLGALASIDAYDGTIVWLNLYPRDVPEPNRLMGMAWNARQRMRGASTPVKPWTQNPVIVSAGRVFVLPSDASQVLVYDAASGIEIKRIPTSGFEDAQSLLGVINDQIILAADKSVFCVNWQDFDESRTPMENLSWRASFSKAQHPEDAIRGRGFVTQDAVIVPTAWALHRIALRSGKVEASYPSGGAEWAEEEGAGNLLVTQDRLIVATPTRVNVYTDLRLAMAKLDAEVAAAPDRPEPRLRYAEIMSVAGKWDVAIAKLDEAMALMGGPGAGDSPARERLFADALAFAQRVARDGSTAALDTATELFDRAAAAAQTPSQHVNYRLARARVLKSRLSPADELKLYQEILADAPMREVQLSGTEGSARAAGVVAERAITDLLARAGRALYQTYETEAEQMLAAAEAEQDPDVFLSIAQQFPNAKAAPVALLSAAKAYEVREDPRQAAQVLRQLLFRYPDAPDRARIFELLARSYLALPNRTEVAIARLSQGARLPGARLSEPLRLPDGRVLENMSFDEAVAALREFNERQSSRQLVDMRLPSLSGGRAPQGFVPPPPESVITGISALVLPERGFARNDRVVAFSPLRGLCVYEPGRPAPLFASDDFRQPPRGAAWNGPNLIAWTESDVFVFAEEGQLLSRTGVAQLPPIDVTPIPEQLRDLVDVPDAEDHEARIELLEGEGRLVIRGQGRVIIRPQVAVLQPAAQPAAAPVAGPEQVAHVRPLTDRVVIVTTHGRVFAVDGSNGSVLWQARPSERGATHLLANDDFVVVRLDDEARVQLLVIDALSGQLLSRRNYGKETGMVPLNLALAPDGTLVWILPDRICGKDLFEPGDRLTFEYVPTREANTSVFAGATGAEHLQMTDGRIFVLSDNGMYVRVFSLDNGQPLRGDNTDLKLATGAQPGAWNAILRPSGRRLYVVGRSELSSYDLQNVSHTQTSTLSPWTSIRPRDMVVTQSHVVVLSEPGDGAGAARPRRAGVTQLQVQSISRAPLRDTGRETGLLELDDRISDPATILAWQPVNGGLMYLGGDQRLHFLRGARGE